MEDICVAPDDTVREPMAVVAAAAVDMIAAWAYMGHKPQWIAHKSVAALRMVEVGSLSVE